MSQILRYYSIVILTLSLFQPAAHGQKTAAEQDPFQHPFANPVDNPKLPRVLIVGDSISIGYTPRVRKLLDGNANVHRPNTNCRWSAFGNENIENWIGDSKWDVIHFNFGLWDWYGWSQEVKATPESYATSLEGIVSKLKKTNAQLVFGVTTPPCVGPERKVKIIISEKRAQEFNNAAIAVMKKHGVHVNDLYGAIGNRRTELQRGENDVHYTEEGRDVLAAQVAKAIGQVLPPADTLPALESGKAPQDFAQMWAGFDPRAEPLEVEELKTWQEDGVTLKIVRFRIGVFKGQKAKLAAVYGYPTDAAQSDSNKSAQKLPGLVQIHGGGQYADYKACLTNAKRGYATISIAWAGRISAPGYQVSPAEVQLFWDGKTDDPRYRLTTDWGAVDGYHAPGRNAGNHFPSAKAAAWTLDSVESPRNSGWFLCAIAARRALTFLERQPQVDPERLGVYGHSMGGKLTVMSSVDPRVKAAAPSCGGISDRYNKSPLFRATVGDDVSLKQIKCPIIFLSPANDFHGRIGDLPASMKNIQSQQWRVTCAPHHNHQDTAEYEVATQLWMDQHLKNSFVFPQTPETVLDLQGNDGSPTVTVKPDASHNPTAVNVFYTQDGKPNESPQDLSDVKSRFWHHASAVLQDGVWTADLPIANTEKHLWVYANVDYPLEQPVTGAGYYYGIYTAKSFNVSSMLKTVTPDELREAGVQAKLKPSNQIEDFSNDWDKEWFNYRQGEWARTTYKLTNELWQPPAGAMLSLNVQSAEANKLVILLDDYAAEIQLNGGNTWQKVLLSPSDFRNFAGERLASWDGVRSLKLTPAEHLRNPKQRQEHRLVGGTWKGNPPKFQDLRWQQPTSFLDTPRDSNSGKDYTWTTDHMHVGVRWQPFIGRPKNNEYDATRPIIANDSSYAQFWVAWSALEPTEAHKDYANRPSAGLQAIEHAVNTCNAKGIKVEFVLFHCPRWASESGQAGGHKPKDGLFPSHVRRLSRYFKGRVHAYQLAHECNLEGMMEGADIDFRINEVLLGGAKVVRQVYDVEPKTPVILSTTGMSPCEGCGVAKGLEGTGARAVSNFYDLMIGSPELMANVDALNMNVSDHDTGYGNMDGKIIPSVWGQYDLVREKLDKANLTNKAVLSSESWIVWDNANNAQDVTGDGNKTERDAYRKAITIIGKCLERGLNTINLPWSDNSSGWAMGLTKRRDYNGRIAKLKPEIVVSANDGGPGIVTRKLGLQGNDENFKVVDGGGHVYTVDQYINPGDPNHLHYYIWRWYAQISSGSDEVVRHAVAGESGNDITVTGDAFSGEERYRISSYNRTKNQFIVLLYADGADGSSSATVSIPATIQTGKHYNHDRSKIDFRGEGFAAGETYFARIITKDISEEDGTDVNSVYSESAFTTVEDGTLTVQIPKMNRFTAIEFARANPTAVASN